MMGRCDVEPTTKCPSCFGTGRDRKKRTRSCPRCQGVGKVMTCQNCYNVMPCPGTDPDMFDQSSCNLPTRPLLEGEAQC